MYKRRILAEGIVRVTLVLTFLILVGLAVDGVLGIPAPHHVAGKLTGIALVGGGIALEGTATKEFWSTGRGTPHPKLPPQILVTGGPYRFSRNPLYVARIVILVGAALLFSSIGIAIVVSALIVVLHFSIIPKEERRLEARFGVEYKAYRERVRRWLTIQVDRGVGIGKLS